MKKKLFKHGIAVIGIAVFAFFALGSAASTASTTKLQSISDASAQIDVTNKGIFGEAVLIPVKDFQTLGLVFTEHVYEIDAVDADVFTYQALLKEAKKLNADAIINVTIDRRRQTITEQSTSSTTSGSSSNTKTTAKVYVQETWYGSALAIKYTTAITGTVTNTARDPLTGNSASGGSSASSSTSSSSNQQRSVFGLGLGGN